MKAKKFTAIILALVMCISVMCVFASASYEIRTWRDYFDMDDNAGLTHDELVEKDSYAKDHKWEMLFNSGTQGSAESTGICGGVYLANAPDEAGRAEDFDPYLPAGSTNKTIMHYTGGTSDAVTWTLKNGVLTFSGVGPMTKGFKGNGQDNPFYQNEHIKVVVFEEGITDIQGIILDELPNLETVIFMSNKTNPRYVVDARTCPNLKTIISGADLKSGKAVDYVTQGDYQNFVTIAFGSTADGHDGYANDGVTYSGQKALAYHTKAELITMAKAALTNVPAEVLNKLPAELSGGSNNGGNTDPNPDHGNDNNHGHKGDRTVSSWAQADVTRATELGIVPADLSPDFTKGISRAEFCHIATALYETVTGEEITGRMSFSDTNDIAVQKMASLGVINGVGDNKFAPNNTLTRAQAATIICRLGNVMGKSFIVADDPFTDIIGNWAAESIAQVYGAGIMNGNSATTFNPNGTYTTQQSIVTMLRLYNVVA